MNKKILTGTIVAQGHFQAGKPNQDSFGIQIAGNNILGVVSDGVSEGEYSEFGSRLLVHFTLKHLMEHLRQGGGDFNVYSEEAAAIFLRSLSSSILWSLWSVAQAMSFDGIIMEAVSRSRKRPDVEVIAKYMQATLIFFIMSESSTLVARIGDGVVNINGQEMVFDSGESNAPDSISHGLVDPKFLKGEPKPDFSLVHFGTTASIQSLIIGTDGLVKFNKLAERVLPDGSQVGTYQDFTGVRFQKNQLLVQRRMNLMNINDIRPADDATLIGVVEG